MKNLRMNIFCSIEPNTVDKKYLKKLLEFLRKYDFLPQINNMEWANRTKYQNINGLDDVSKILDKFGDSLLNLNNTANNVLNIFNSEDEYKWSANINLQKTTAPILFDFLKEILRLKKPYRLECELSKISRPIYYEYFEYETITLCWYHYFSDAYLEYLEKVQKRKTALIYTNPYAKITKLEGAVIQVIGDSPLDILTEEGKQQQINSGKYLLEMGL